MSDSVSEELRRYVKIVEGEYIPNRPRTLLVKCDKWDEFPRMMIRWHDPFYQYKSFDHGTLVFYDEISYKEAKEKLKKLGVEYDELSDDTTNNRDNELEPSKAGSMSPYPSNTNRFDHEF